MVRYMRLSSGFWAIWIGNAWIDAASPSREAAEEKARELGLEARA